MDNNPGINRRQFFRKCTNAVVLSSIVGAGGICLYNAEVPDKNSVKSRLFQFPDFSIKELSDKIAIVRGESSLNRVTAIQLAFKALGGIEKFIKKGDHVLLKVNAAFASPAILSATTNPELLKEVCRLCFSAGAATVIVTDNPINDPASCFRLTGIEKAALSSGAEIYIPQENSFSNISLPEAKLIKDWPLLLAPFKNINKVIGLTPVKDHQRSGASLTMKNWYGLLGGYRNVFHQNIHDIIKELAMMIKPTLVILDGTVSMMTNGPTGGSLSDLKETNTLIVSTNQVAADALGADLLGKHPDDLAYIKKAEQIGIGMSDISRLNPYRINM